MTMPSLAESPWNSIAIDVGEEHHPKQAIAVFGAGLDVGREISRIHIGDRSDDRRAGEGQRRAQPAAPAGQRPARRGDGPLGQRCRRSIASLIAGLVIGRDAYSNDTKM